jgi:hypothetical protein
MMDTSLFSNVRNLVEEIGNTKQAAAQKEGYDDPGGMEGPTSHPSKKDDPNEQAATEGSRSAENTKDVKEMVTGVVDSKPDATPENAPKDTEVQQGEGVDKAKPTGEDPSNEDNYKGKIEGDKREGDQGGTTHPANANIGEKYSSAQLEKMSWDELFSEYATIGDEIAADLANGHFGTGGEQKPADPKPKEAADEPRESEVDANDAAAAGEKAAADADDNTEQLNELASEVIQNAVKAAYDNADQVTEYLARELAAQKQAMEGEDPTGGAGEGEDHGTEADPGGGMPGEVPPAGAEELLSAMAGGVPEGGAMEGGGMEGGGMEGGGMPPEAGGPEGMGEGAPPELDAMSEEQALNELVAALEELGISPEELAAAGTGMGDETAPKIASAAKDWKRSGGYKISAAEKDSAARAVRDFMKGYVREIFERSQK